MADLQCVLTDDDPFDDELQDGLPVGNRGAVQPSSNAFAKGGKACQDLLGVRLLLA
jgi:hypothetical protein